MNRSSWPHEKLAVAALHIALTPDLPAAPLELVVNRRAAKALGLTIPLSILLRADQVIQ